MKRNQPRKLSDLWTLLQEKESELLLPPANKSDERRLASLDRITDLPANIAAFVGQYREGDYRTLLRNLDDISDELPWVAILRILCLLRMAEYEEMVGETAAIEFLRDRVLLQDRQTIQETGLPELQRLSVWIERFCLGYEPPKEFWEAAYESTQAVTNTLSPLKVSVERLDFGILEPGQGASASFEVEGGPGQIVAESDQVKISPQHFDPPKCTVQVTVQPLRGATRGTLLTELMLLSDGATLKVPIVAEWREQATGQEESAAAGGKLSAREQEQTTHSGVPPALEQPIAQQPQVLTSASQDGTVRRGQAQAWAALAVLRGHTEPVNSVAWSPDGRWLASGSWDMTVRLWDAVSRAALAVLRGHTEWVTSVAWSPDGRRLASASDDCTVRLWDASSGAELAVLRGHTWPMLSVAWSPDGRAVVSTSGDCTVRLWDASSGVALAVLWGHTGLVRSVAWSPDGRTLASAGADRTVRLWGIEEPSAQSSQSSDREAKWG